jgi:hypothetical protein
MARKLASSEGIAFAEGMEAAACGLAPTCAQRGRRWVRAWTLGYLHALAAIAKIEEAPS